MFQNEFPDLLDFCNNLSGKCTILGDMAAHFYLKKKRTKDSTVKVVSSLDMLSFCQAVNEPTHEHGHTLDWVRFRLEDNVLCSSTVTRAIASDHFCVVCELCVAVPPDPAVYRESRKYVR